MKFVSIRRMTLLHLGCGVVMPGLTVSCRAAPADMWVGTWASSPQLVEPQNRPPAPGLAGNTLRQVVHLTLGGSRIRLRFTNEFGASPLTLESVRIASATGPGTIDTKTNRAVTFGGKPSMTLAAGSLALSDPISFKVEAESDLIVTLKAGAVPDGITGHPGSRATSFLAPGDQVSAASLANAVKTEHWYLLDGVDVMRNGAAAIVTLGDSITDGHGSLTDRNTRWPDYLARDLIADKKLPPRSVLNEGIGGNCILRMCLGPSALSRFDRDVAGQNGARWVIVLEGVNDIGGTRGATDKGEPTTIADDVIAGYRQLIAKAHAHGLKIYGATITAFGQSFYANASTLASRARVNDWIRTSGQFDAVIDFDKATRNPDKPDQLDAAFDSGDHLHLNSDGYRKLAASIDLNLFDK